MPGYDINLLDAVNFSTKKNYNIKNKYNSNTKMSDTASENRSNFRYPYSSGRKKNSPEGI